MKTCYYELLQVEATATDQEIKKAYRKKALQLHPDKNPDDVDGANRRFALVRAAYDVLSDPQERSWYDSHKGQILNDDNATSAGASEMAVPSMHTDELLRYFNSALYSWWDDSVGGSYNVAGRVFEQLAAEEVKHAKYQQLRGYDKYMDDSANVGAIDAEFLLFPRFGNSHSDYASAIRGFYQKWGSFATVKSFSWVDEHRYSTAPDRRTRRIMEKENKRARDSARKDFNETVRKYVTFIKGRDPRVRPGIEKFELAKRKKEQQRLQKQVQQLKLEKMAASSSYEAQDWENLDLDELQQLEAMFREEFEYESEDAASSDSEFDHFSDADASEQFECIVCDKLFKSHKQLNVHEQSKKHKHMIQELRREMVQEGLDLGIDEETHVALESDGDNSDQPKGREEAARRDESGGQNREHAEVYVDDVDVDVDDDVDDVDDDVDDTDAHDIVIDDVVDDDVDDTDAHDIVVDDVVDDDVAETPLCSRTESQNISSKTKTDKTTNVLEEQLADLAVHSDSDDWSMDKKKKGKKKKRSPKSDVATGTPKEPKSEQPSSSGIKCVTCSEPFPSRNKLFQHVKRTGHAAPLKETKKKGKKK